MAAYLRYSGLHISYPLPGGKTGFIIQSDLLENFNDSAVVANASYFKDAPIWGHTELHITRAWLSYVYFAANTKVGLLFVTGPDPIRWVAPQVLCCAKSAAAGVTTYDTGEFDIPLDPSGAVGTTSRIQFALIAVGGVNAGDDVGLIFQGWYRDDVPEEEETESIDDTTTDRGILDQISELLSSFE